MTSLEQPAPSQIVKLILTSDKDNGRFQMIISIIEVKEIQLSRPTRFYMKIALIQELTERRAGHSVNNKIYCDRQVINING